MRSKITAALVTGFAALNSGCGDPCVDLSHYVCDCESTQAKQQDCRRRVDVESGSYKASEAQKNRCSELLDTTCNNKNNACAKLAAGDLNVCGITE